MEPVGPAEPRAEDGENEDPLASMTVESDDGRGGSAPACDGDDNGNGIDVRDRARRLLCAAQWCAELSEWIGQFCVYAWLDAVGGGSSLFLAGAYQLTSQVLVLLAVPRLTVRSGERRGRFLSRVVAGQNSCIVLMALCFAWALRLGPGDDDAAAGESDPGPPAARGPLWTTVMAAAFLAGGAGEVLHQSYLVTIERDWIVAMANGDEVWLRRTTVFLKQIHLVCIILGPVITGQIVGIGQAGGSLGVELVIGLRLISLAVEYLCLNEAHRMLPTLQGDDGISMENTILALDLDHAGDSATGTSDPGVNKCRALRGYRDDLQVYASQPIAWAGLGYALLYCDVLTFGGMMTTFLKSRGITWSAIGVLQGVSNLAGLLGTCAFSISRQRMSLESSALWSVWWQFACLTVAASSVLTGDWGDDDTNDGGSSSLTVSLIIAGVIPSRIGLWVHSISITQLFQITVPPDARGRVGGTQTSINSSFELSLFVLCMVFPDARDFWILMLVGYASVGVAAALFLIKIYLPYRSSALYKPARRSEHELADVRRLPEIS